jgi:UDP-N-acetylmuramate: L-alanyl-gamma-D-glutamyl-meso-diaminopimelate ligase
MGSVAAMLQKRGFRVTGSDENPYPPISTFLETRGIKVNRGYRPENLPEDPQAWIVVGNAIKRGNPELEEALASKRSYLSLPEVLRFFFLRGRRNLVVTGTHGKTTTASALAWILECAKEKPSFLIGGIPGNFGEGCRLEEGSFWVLEGDEYDTAFFDKRSKFLHYLPETVLVNNIEFDHADIFPDICAIEASFQRLVHLLPRNGWLVLNADDPRAEALAARSPAPVVRVGFSEQADFPIRDVSLDAKGSFFRLQGRQFHIPLYGIHNIRNAAMAVAAARCYQVPWEVCAEALTAFLGVRRRQEVLAERGGVIVLDDFGHHPTAILQTLAALRERYRGRRLWALFEPRSNTSRRRVFQQELTAALAGADGVVIARVHRGAELGPEEKLDAEAMVGELQKKGVFALYETDTLQIPERLFPLLRPGDVVVCFSNGSFDGVPQRLVELLERHPLNR